MSYEFCSKFHALSFQQCKSFENQLRFDKVTESLNVGTFLRHSVIMLICYYACSLLYLERLFCFTCQTYFAYNSRDSHCFDCLVSVQCQRTISSSSCLLDPSLRSMMLSVIGAATEGVAYNISSLTEPARYMEYNDNSASST